MKINKHKFIISAAVLVGGIKAIPGQISVGVLDIFAIPAFLLSLKNLKKILYKQADLFIILTSIAAFQFLPLIYEIILSGEVPGVRFLYALRIFEYLLFIYVAVMAAPLVTLSGIYNITLVSFVSIPLIHVFIGHRWGIFQYSWELGAIYSVLFAFLLPIFLSRPSIKNIIMIVALIGFIFYSNQRSPILSLIGTLCGIGLYYGRLKSKSIVIAILISAIILLFSFPNRFSETVGKFEPGKVLLVIPVGISLARNASSYEEFVYQERELLTQDGANDLSFHLRVRKWTYAAVNMDLVQIFIGLGPGYFGGAADSSILRVFFETGFVGIFLWASLFVVILKKYPEARLIVFSFMINGILIDVFYSARVAIITTFLCAWAAFWKESHSLKKRSRNLNYVSAA